MPTASEARQQAAICEALARALGLDAPTAPIAAALVAATPAAIAPYVSDVFLAWHVRGSAPSPEVLDRLRTTIPILRGESERAGDGRAIRARFGLAAACALLAETPEQALAPPPPPPVSAGWEALVEWATLAAPIASPALAGDALAGRQQALVRGVGLALLGEHLVIAGCLLRWLALHPGELGDEIDQAIEHTLRRAERRPYVYLPAAGAFAIRRHLAVRGTAAPADEATPASRPPVERDEIVARALRWIGANMSMFVLGDPGQDARVYKALGELAVTSEVLIAEGTRQDKPGWVSEGRELQHACRDRAGDGARLYALVERDPDLAPLITVIPPLVRTGMPPPAGAAAELLERRAAALPRFLWTFVGASLRELGLASPWSRDEADAASTLAARQPPWLLSTADLYFVLHAAFQRHREGWPAGDPARAYVCLWLPVWLRRAEETGHNDLAAELVLAWHRVHASCAPDYAWRQLLAAQQPDGRVIQARPNGATGLVGDYHSTLVTILAVASCRHACEGETHE